MTLTPISPGRWQLHGVYTFPVFAVRICRDPTVWELQDAEGRSIFSDAFESLTNIRAYFGENT